MLTSEEYENLPEAPEEAVAVFLEISLQRLNQELIELDERNGNQFVVYSRFAAALVGILDECEFDYPPNLAPPETDSGWWEWRNRLQNFANKESARLSFKLKRGAGQRQSISPVVVLDLDFRDRIRASLRKIRGVINAASISEPLRELLFKRLRDFEVDLDRRRTRVEAATVFFYEVTKLSGQAAENLKPVVELLKDVMGLLGQAEERQGIEEEERKSLPAPSTDIDDIDIPF